MSRHYTVRPTSPLRLEASVAEIEPQGNPVTVIGPDIEPKVVTSEEIFDAEGAAGLRVVSTSTANVLVTFADEVRQAASRGSSTAGKTGGLESRTVDELYAEAQEKKIPGRSAMDKDELIAALRAAE